LQKYLDNVWGIAKKIDHPEAKYIKIKAGIRKRIL